jgi:hypothetical protein
MEWKNEYIITKYHILDFVKMKIESDPFRDSVRLVEIYNFFKIGDNWWKYIKRLLNNRWLERADNGRDVRIGKKGKKFLESYGLNYFTEPRNKYLFENKTYKVMTNQRNKEIVELRSI